MARLTKISAGILNIRLHPHPPGRYQEWIEFIFKRRISAKIHGDRYGMISLIDKSAQSLGIITGTITTFVKIESRGEWFNIEELKTATKDDISQINIPHNLYPNSDVFYFYFNTIKHKLYFQEYSSGKTFTPRSAQRFFATLAKDLNVMAQFNEAEVSIVKDKAGLDRIFSLKKLKVLKVTIAKPNTDIFDDEFEQKIEEYLAESHSRQISIVYQADGSGSIQPTESIKKISEAALENGNIEAVGRDDKGAVVINTDSYAKILHDKYDPDAMNERDAFTSLIPRDPPVGI